ncbi:MAG: DUF6962 family protein [Bacteroidia bacterium]
MGLEIQEPMTTLTDLVVAAVCFYAFAKLRHLKSPESSFSYFRYFFLFMGISTTLGGIIGHGLLHYLSFAWKTPGWVAGMFSVALMERGAIMHARHLMNPLIGKVFDYLNIIELCIFMFIAFYTLKFGYVEIHATYGLLLSLFLEIFIFVKRKDEGSKLIMYGVLISAGAAVTHIAKISIHTWFNYFDLSHMFMAASCYVFYLGVRKMTFHSFAK